MGYVKIKVNIGILSVTEFSNEIIWFVDADQYGCFTILVVLCLSGGACIYILKKQKLEGQYLKLQFSGSLYKSGIESANILITQFKFMKLSEFKL